MSTYTHARTTVLTYLHVQFRAHVHIHVLNFCQIQIHKTNVHTEAPYQQMTLRKQSVIDHPWFLRESFDYMRMAAQVRGQ